jgi:hypothetical protein
LPKKRRLLTEAEKKQRQRRAQRRWRKLNPDYGKQWRKANPKRVLAYKKRWRRNPSNVKREERAALARKHAAQNP